MWRSVFAERLVTLMLPHFYEECNYVLRYMLKSKRPHDDGSANDTKGDVDLVGGREVFAILPTGYGKRPCYGACQQYSTLA